MKLHLINRERLQSLGSFLVDEFDSLVARIRAGWNVEHTSEGRHAHVTAHTLASGRVTYSDIAEVALNEARADNFDPAGLSTAAVLRLDSTLDTATLTGVRVPQDESGAVLDGRVLVLENVTGGTTFVLEAESTFSAPRNRLLTPYGPPVDTNSPLRVYLRPSSLLVLVYNAKKARWMMQSQANDATVKYSVFAASQHDDVSTDAVRRVRTFRVEFAATGGSLSGFDGSGVLESTVVRIVNVGLYKFSLLHQSTSSADGNRVQCPGGVRYVLNPRESVDLFKTTTGWRLLEKADQWIDVAYDAGNFTVDGGGSWGVDAGDQTTLAYQIDGNKMTVSFVIQTTDVGATANFLKIAIPNGRIAAREMRNRLAYVLNAGVAAPNAYCRVAAGGTVIEIYVDGAGTAWTATTSDNTWITGQITFMVRDDCAGISEDHTDVAHGDAAHADVDHSDVTHVDVAHADTHSDTPHSDSSHGDIAHSDAHDDAPHSDDPHEDVAHLDVAHTDIVHGDTHDDTGVHEDHGDIEHQDSGPHGDTHDDVTHSDAAHEDTAHSDEAHSDVTHEDAHGDVAHADGAHSDVGHADTHTDTAPHADVPHADGGHGDTAHSDDTHQDVGYHCDTAHADI